LAKALVEVIGDSASAVRALEQTSVAVNTTGDAFKKLTVDADAAAAALVKASSARVDALLTQSASLSQIAATSTAGSTEQALASEAALKRQTQAYRLLGLQAASTASITKTAGDVGRGLTTYVTAPTAFIGYEAVKQALDYNQALLLIRTQAGASQAELENMNQSVLQLVQSGRSYGQTAQQMAQGLYFVESEGIRGGRALAILQAAAAGAAKGQTDMADTTNALTSAMKIWNVAASGAAGTMATIDAITATGKMHLEDLNAAFQTKFFTTAKQLGIPLEQAGAALDVFTKAGVPAETAANNMTTSFIKMLTPAKAAIPYLEQLGLSTDSLGQALQTGGLSKALAELSAGYEHILQTQGKFAANRAVLESFGGSRSGAPALALVQQYGSYLSSLSEIQRLNNPATFWSQVSETMHQPAMQIKQDVAEIGADFIKLGTALAPTVATLSAGIAHISNGFQALPGPVKDAIGVVVGLLAVGGPLGLAVSGIGKLIGGLGAAWRLFSGSAVASAAEADAALSSIGPAADRAAGQVELLVVQEGRVGTVAVASAAEADAAFAGIGAAASAALLPVGVLAVAIKGLIDDSSSIHKLGTTDYGRKVFGHSAGQATVYEQGGKYYEQLPPGMRGRGGPGVREISKAEAYKLTGRSEPQPPQESRAQQAADRAITEGRGPRRTTTPGPDYFTTTIPIAMQQRLASAQLSGNVAAQRAALDQEKAFLAHEATIARTKEERLQATQAEIAVDAQLAALQKKTVASAQQDELLARARNDLAQGEVAAARALLEQDKARLEAMLAEAKTSQERTSALNQLATVNRLLHTKSDQFQLPARLQMEMARADAQAALTGASGPTAQQLALARQAKATAMKAINSHTLTMQGLIAAWQIVGQENSVLAQARGAVNTYHVVSTDAVADSIKGLTQAQEIQLRERLAQRDAHRGYAPNAPGDRGPHHRQQHPLTERQQLERLERQAASGRISLGQAERQIVQIDGGIHLHGIQNIHQLEAELAKLARRKHQRVGARR
jgi:TP901 family phage tail tape measure protein